MTEKRKYTREEMQTRVRDMLRGLGVDVPDKLPRRKVVVHDDNGRVVKSYWVGCDKDEEENEQR